MKKLTNNKKQRDFCVKKTYYNIESAFKNKEETKMDDAQIIKLFFDRDENAIEQTRQTYGAKCNSIAYGVLKNRQDAEEAVSDAYLALWNNIPPDRPAVFCAYLYKTVRNLALLRYNAEMTDKRRANAEASPITELDECISPDRVDEQYEERELTDIINGFLKTLGESDRRIFVCRYFANMEYKEIAKKYGFTQSRVKMSLHRSREKLKKTLIKEGYCNE
ncbi:MAG: sigma-70 family RNA polymerase sigma factor [Clostridia bacterium]|nr:sigma-70 family RNA polymerase sigma factor [Clostridia bacterium]